MTRLSVYLAGPIASGHNAKLSVAFADHVNLLHHVVNPGIVDPEFYDQGLTPNEIYASATKALLSSDAVVAEISAPSHGVGMELFAAHAAGIASLCIYDPSQTERVSAMVAGCPGLTVHAYDDWASGFHLIDDFLSRLAGSP